MTKRLVRKDPATDKIISEVVSCDLAKSCVDCPLVKCVYEYRGIRKVTKAIEPNRIELIQDLDGKGWAVYGICELIGVDERLVKLALERTPEFIEKLKIARR